MVLVKHNRSEVVAVLGPNEALPYYIHIIYNGPGWRLDARLTTLLCKKKRMLRNPEKLKADGLIHTPMEEG
jgi:hypothetical protein